MTNDFCKPQLSITHVDEFGFSQTLISDMADSTVQEALEVVLRAFEGFGFHRDSVNRALSEVVLERGLVLDIDVLPEDILTPETIRKLREEAEKGGDIDS